MSDKLPPHDEQAEAGLLGCLTLDGGDRAHGWVEQLQDSDFYVLSHRTVFRALAELHEDGESLDVIALRQRLIDNGKLEDAGGDSFIAVLPDQTPSPEQYPTYFKRVKQFAERRRMLVEATQLEVHARDLRRPVEVVEAIRQDPWFEHAGDAADIVVEELPELVQIVEGIMAENAKAIIASSAKAFKTWLSIHMGLAISHGVPFLGRATTRRRVLYVNLELKTATFKRRVQPIAKAMGITVERGWFIHQPLRGRMAGVKVPDLVTRIIRIAKHFGAAVVILDPVFKANTEGEENNTRDQTVFFNELDRITTEGNATLILNDHSTKGNQSEKDPLDVIRGSSAKGGDVDAAMILRKHDEGGCYRVDMVHRELPPVEPFTIGWNYPLMELRPELDPANMRKAKGGRSLGHDPKKLLEHIEDTTAREPISVNQWAKAAKIPRQTLTDYLPGMRVKGWIATSGEGSKARQYITAKGLETLNGTGGQP